MSEEYLPSHARKDKNSKHDAFMNSIHVDISKSYNGVADFIESQKRTNPYFDQENPFAPVPGQAEEYLPKEH